MKWLSVLVAALVMSAATAFAAAGDTELKLVTLIFTGNIGLLLGLGVTIMGVFMLIKGNVGGAILTIFLGVLITMLPGVYNGLRDIFCPIAESLGGKCGEGSSDS